jgi:hypothetical protein
MLQSWKQPVPPYIGADTGQACEYSCFTKKVRKIQTEGKNE